jgi:hypothetical protein
VIPYFVLLGIWMLGAIQFSSRMNVPYERLMYGAALVFTIAMVGLRYRVGGDWYTYEDMFDGEVYTVNLACAAVFVLGLSRLTRKQPKPWLAMAVAIPYLVIVVGMGYTRQAAAIGVICWAISTSENDSIWKTVAKVAFAALFHKTAILFLPILLGPAARRNTLAGVFGAVAFVGLAAVVLGASSDRLITNYVNSNYQSGGAAIRIAMNVVAAALFFMFRKKFAVSPHDRLIWTIMSGLSVACILGFFASSSSVGVDRLALFLIPLQVFVYGNIPSMYTTRGSFATATLAVMAYSFTVQYVYLVHGTYSYTWLPYRNAVTDRTDVNERVY